jgi:hypothetical protein
MNIKNGSKMIELQFRAVVKTLDLRAQEVPSKCQVGSADMITPTPRTR